MNRYDMPFQPVGSSHQSFSAAVAGETSAVALQSTGLREWYGPMRTVRLCETGGIDYNVAFGSSLAQALSTDSMFLLGNTVEIFQVAPSVTHIAFYSSTSTTVNVTLGTGH